MRQTPTFRFGFLCHRSLRAVTICDDPHPSLSSILKYTPVGWTRTVAPIHHSTTKTRFGDRTVFFQHPTPDTRHSTLDSARSLVRIQVVRAEMGVTHSIVDQNTKDWRHIAFYSCSANDRTQDYTIAFRKAGTYRVIQPSYYEHVEEKEGQPCYLRDLAENSLWGFLVGSEPGSSANFHVHQSVEGQDEKMSDVSRSQSCWPALQRGVADVHMLSYHSAILPWETGHRTLESHITLEKGMTNRVRCTIGRRV